MKRNRMFYIVVFFLAGMIWLSGVVNADDVVVELPSINGDDAFQVKDSDGLSLMNVLSDGKVGIGTTTPKAQRLHISIGSSGATAAGSADELVIEGIGTVGMSFLTSNTEAGQIRFGDPQDGGVAVISYNHADNSMRFRVAGTNYLGIDILSSGNVGIGTRAPATITDIQKNSNSGVFGNYPTLRVMNTNPDSGNATNFASLWLESGNGAVQGGLFSRYDTGPFSGLYLWDNSNHPIGFFTNAIERMRIESGTGNVIINSTTTARVGIGTTAPAEKLSVAGTIESTSGGIKFPDGTTQTTTLPLVVSDSTPGVGATDSFSAVSLFTVDFAEIPGSQIRLMLRGRITNGPLAPFATTAFYQLSINQSSPGVIPEPIPGSTVSTTNTTTETAFVDTGWISYTKPAGLAVVAIRARVDVANAAANMAFLRGATIWFK